MMNALTSYLDEHINDAQALLERLCRQPSVAAQNWGMAEMADLVESLLREKGFRSMYLFEHFRARLTAVLDEALEPR